MTWHDALRRTAAEQHDDCRQVVDRVAPTGIMARPRTVGVTYVPGSVVPVVGLGLGHGDANHPFRSRNHG